MRLLGYAFKHPEPPLRSGYLPLGQLTVLLGPNDSGKSSLLRAVARDLDGGHFAAARDDQDAALTGGVFYAQVEDAELARLLRAARREQAEERRRRSRGHGLRPPRRAGLWVVDLTRLGDDAGPRSACATALRARADRDAIVDALEGSSTIALECGGRDDEGKRVWNLYWCLPPFEELERSLQEALTDSDLGAFRHRRSRRGLVFEDAIWGRPLHLRVPQAPVAVASLGFTSDVAMPVGVAVPTSFDALRDAVTDAVTTLVNALRHAREDAVREGDPLTAEEEAARAAPRGWLERGDGEARIVAETVNAYEFLTRAIDQRLPAFVADRYRLDLHVPPVDEWFQRPPLDLHLVPRRTDGRVEDFPVDRVAEGFRLWVQLAVLDALEDGARAERLVWGRATEAYDAARDVERMDPEDPARHRAIEEAEVASELLDAVGRDIWRLLPDASDAAAPAGDGTTATADARRLFTIDEPERHLHGTLQRAAAAWLARTAARSGAPVLLATHAAAFLSLPPTATTYVRTRRTDEGIELERFDPAAVEQLDAVAADMGFDRGELLSALSCWLVVEGPGDKVVLETLLGAELTRAGIVVVPLHGVARYRGILEADALWRYVRAPVAVMYDGISAQEVEALLAQSDQELDAMRKEARTGQAVSDMALLIRTARAAGRTVHPVPLPRPDVLDCLDDGAITEQFPRWPGGEAADQAFARQSRERRDAFLQRRYGVTKEPEALGEIAARMRAAGVRSAPLEEAVAYCAGVVAFQQEP